MVLPASFKNSYVGIILLALPMFVSAEEQAFVENIPSQVSPRAAISAAEAALAKRQWFVTSRDERSVAGELKHGKHDCEIVISIEGRSLNFDGACLSLKRAKGASARQKKELGAIPSRWVAYLRQDTETNLVMQSQREPECDASKPVKKSVADRLRGLKALKKEGLLTDAEYQKKRAELVEQL